MTIETKFGIGDKVWVVNDTFISGKVEKIVIILSSGSFPKDVTYSVKVEKGVVIRNEKDVYMNAEDFVKQHKNRL